MRLTDHARSYDPTATPPPDLTVIPWEREGGLGVHLMRQFTDQVIYTVGRDGSNQLTLIKHVPPAETSL